MDPTLPPNYMTYAMARESGGDPNAQNPHSSAGGLYQFTTPTWNDVMQRHPELNLTADGRFDPAQANKAMQAFATDNANTLSSNGVPVNNSTLYLAHRFGAGGAMKALAADPTAPVSSVFGDDVMKANPDLKNKRVGDVTGYATPQAQTPTGNSMPDNSTPALTQAMQQQPQQPALFGGNMTPVGALGGIARMLGIGSEPDLGNHLKNAGAALMSVGNFGQDGARGAAMMQEAANQPHFNVVTDALGNRFMVDTRTGAVVSPSGAGMNQPGTPGAAPQNPNGMSGALAQTPVALATRAKAEQDASQEKMKALEDGAAAAQGAIDQNTQALKLSQSSGTLQGPGLWNMIRDKVADATGGTFGGVDIAQQHELDKLNQNLVSSMLATQKGIRFAAPEIKFGQSASADLEKPAATNQQIYSNNIQIAKRAIAARDLARQHMATYGVLGPEYSKQLQSMQDANPIYQSDAVKPTGAPANRPSLDSIFK